MSEFERNFQDDQVNGLDETEPGSNDLNDPKLLKLEAEARRLGEEGDKSMLRGQVDDVVRMYLKEVGRTPLLTLAQEQVLIRLMQLDGDEEREISREEVDVVIGGVINMRAALEFDQEEVVVGGNEDQLDEEVLEAMRIKVLTELGQNGMDIYQIAGTKKEAKDYLIKANLRLVISVAKIFIGRGVPFADLIQEGNIGLMKGVGKFDTQKSGKLSTYATWWIRQTISRYIHDTVTNIRIPVHTQEATNLVIKIVGELDIPVEKLQQDDLAIINRKIIELGKDKITEDMFKRILQLLSGGIEVSADAQDDGTSLFDIISAEEDQPDFQEEELEEIRLFIELVGKLTEEGNNDTSLKMKFILVLRNGLDRYVDFKDLFSFEDFERILEMYNRARNRQKTKKGEPLNLSEEERKKRNESINNMLKQRYEGEKEVKGVPLILEDVGEICGVTRERIRQIEEKAYSRVRRLAIKEYEEGNRAYQGIAIQLRERLENKMEEKRRKFRR